MKYQKITKVSKKLQQYSSDKVTTENDKEIPTENYMYVYPVERQTLNIGINIIV